MDLPPVILHSLVLGNSQVVDSTIHDVVYIIITSPLDVSSAGSFPPINSSICSSPSFNCLSSSLDAPMYPENVALTSTYHTHRCISAHKRIPVTFQQPLIYSKQLLWMHAYRSELDTFIEHGMEPV